MDGYEVDLFMLERKIAIECDGAFYHAGKKDLDFRKSTIASKNGIRLIRFVENASQSGRTDEVAVSGKFKPTGEGFASFERAITELFGLLELPIPDIDIARDRFFD